MKTFFRVTQTPNLNSQLFQLFRRKVCYQEVPFISTSVFSSLQKSFEKKTQNPIPDVRQRRSLVVPRSAPMKFQISFFYSPPILLYLLSLRALVIKRERLVVQLYSQKSFFLLMQSDGNKMTSAQMTCRRILKPTAATVLFLVFRHAS